MLSALLCPKLGPTQVGYATYTAAQSAEGAKARAVVRTADQPATVSNEFYSISLDYTTNRVTGVRGLHGSCLPPFCCFEQALACAFLGGGWLLLVDPLRIERFSFVFELI